MKKLVVIDAQGGGIGKQLISEIRRRNLEIEVIAVGTNSTASSNMLKAGADHAATGENSVVVTSRRADFIMGPIGIAVADAMLGEITSTMSTAIGQSTAYRILIPINNCGTFIAGVEEKNMKSYIEEAVDRLESLL